MSKSLPAHDGQFVFPRGIQSWYGLASHGHFVYVYLRANGSPYYVGLAKHGNRVMQRHVCAVPKSHSRIRVMRSGLSQQQAVWWERFYIARYGRKDIGTGILRNRTDGGDGLLNPSPEVREKLSVAGKAQADRCRLMAAQMKGVPLSPEHRSKVGRPGRPKTEDHKAKIGAAQRGRSKPYCPPKDPIQKAQKLSAALKGRRIEGVWRDRLVQSSIRRGITQRAKRAHSYGLPFVIFDRLTQGQINSVKRRFRAGLYGMELLADRRNSGSASYWRAA